MSDSSSASRAPQQAPLDGALVRVAVRGEAWAERLPPCPRGADVSASFTDAEAALVHADALAVLGYRVVGVQPHVLSPSPAADFLVPQRVLEAHPRWWRALADQAERAFSLEAGPVLAGLSDVLLVHRPRVRRLRRGRSRPSA